ncbi:MAG: CoA-binding protein, partial [Quisquiliibacterium sp.]
MSGDWIRALLDPRAVALVGASGDIRKNTARPQRFLTACGWQGRILPINPARPEILGLPAYKSLLDAPGEIDQAFIMLGADDVEGVIEQCAQRAVPVATIFSDGFAEIGGDGVAKQARLVDTARRLGVRLLGPNCIGLIRSDNGLALTVNAVLDTDRPRPGSLGLISQSGSMLGSIMSRGLARGLAFSTMVSVGNEADIGVAELIEVLIDDPKTETILLFLETLRDAPAFARAVGRARAAGKPVAAYLLGQSAIGEALAQSHTGAIAGSGRALRAFLAQCGVIQLSNLE